MGVHGPIDCRINIPNLKTIGGNQTYRQAPMSVLLLDERPPIFTLTKTTNTFASRHHLRVFDPALQYDGVKVLTSSSTQDIGIAFSPKQKTFIHVIDQYIDNERSKVVNDLVFTGCVDAVQLVPRPWVPQDAYNSTDDRLRTDGAIAVLKINDCEHPKTSPTDNAVPPSRVERITRDTMLTLRNDIWRGNVGYQGVTATIWLRKYLATKDELKPESGAWRKANVAGADFRGFGTVSSDRQPSTRISPGNDQATTPGPAEIALQESHRWDPPRYEIGLQGGYLRYPVTRNENVVITVIPNAGTEGIGYAASLANAFEGGWTAGVFLTLNTWKWFSSEFAYTYERGKYDYASIFTEPFDLIYGRSSLVTRQFDYNLLWNLRPPRSRWRPYAAAGPALILTALGDAPLKKAAGPFKLGLQNVGLLLAAFDFGSTPPLDGGGVFSIGLQYGGGVKYRILPRLTMIADFRETWSKNPLFLTDSYTKEYFSEEGYHFTQDRVGPNTAYQQQRVSLGFAFTF